MNWVTLYSSVITSVSTFITVFGTSPGHGWKQADDVEPQLDFTTPSNSQYTVLVTGGI